METLTSIISEDHNQYVGPVYEQYYAKLFRYFLMNLRNAPEAAACAEKAILIFFVHMKDRCWVEEEEFVSDNLMKIAGGVCTEKLIEKKERRENSLLGRFVGGVAQSVRERVDAARFHLSGEGGGGRLPGVRQLLSLRHALSLSS